MNNSTKKIKILCLHSLEDLEIIQKLEKHLIAANQNIEFYTISDNDIESSQRNTMIQDKFDSIHIFLLSISINFITSKINTSYEMQQVMNQYKERKSIVIPVILTECNWYTFPYSLLQSIPKRPITDNSWNSIDDAIINVVEGVDQVITYKVI